MPSEPNECFVWIWLPAQSDPVVCGLLRRIGSGWISFNYGRSYLDRTDAVAIFEPELPLRAGAMYPASKEANGLPLCIDDAMPDAWGRRLVGLRRGDPNSELGEITYLLESGSDRIGALDFQIDSTRYISRDIAVPLERLAAATQAIDTGADLDAALHAALLRGTSIGGARPKAMLDADDRKLIAKFSSTADTYPVVQAEYVAMTLARRAGLDVAPVELVSVAGKYVLLVERFDRGPGAARRRMVSALTILGLTSFPEGRYATYADLADQIRRRFLDPVATLRELYGRIVFNILCSNTDDHGRNHAAFVENSHLALTPAYDVCPQQRTGTGAVSLAMAYNHSGGREANLTLLRAAARVYLLDAADADGIIEHIEHTIRRQWHEVCDEAQLTRAQRTGLWARQFLHPAAFGDS